ncbi:MAG: YggS family pyridoxal phosphate-dependent enzyme [Ferruginibacter sp.]
MAFLKDKYQNIKAQLDKNNVTLVAVSKTKTVEDILDAYNNGVRDFGENYVQELVDKYEALPKDIRWHFIGHLQTNKVKYIAGFVHLIHSVDSEKLLLEIAKQATKIKRVIDCLLQVYISKDETKFGFDEQELEMLIKKMEANNESLKHISIKGLMGMATFTEDNGLIETEFNHLKTIFDRHNKAKTESLQLTILSMGMSADYTFGINAGSNMVRIGSLLFGERNYKK